MILSSVIILKTSLSFGLSMLFEIEANKGSEKTNSVSSSKFTENLLSTFFTKLISTIANCYLELSLKQQNNYKYWQNSSKGNLNSGARMIIKEK